MVELKNMREKSVIMQFADAILDVFEDSEAVAEGFSYARYFNQKGISPKWKKANEREGNAEFL